MRKTSLRSPSQWGVRHDKMDPLAVRAVDCLAQVAEFRSLPLRFLAKAEGMESQAACLKHDLLGADEQGLARGAQGEIGWNRGAHVLIGQNDEVVAALAILAADSFGGEVPAVVCGSACGCYREARGRLCERGWRRTLGGPFKATIARSSDLIMKL